MVEIREGNLDDAEAISRLVIDCTRKHIGPTLSEYGLNRLVNAMSSENQRERISGEYEFFLAIKDTDVVGTAAIKLPDHLYYLFVKTEFQKLGIGNQLFDTVCKLVLKTNDSESLSVNSSLNSVSFYSRLGFVEAGPVKNDDEIVFQPMTLKLSGLLKST